MIRLFNSLSVRNYRIYAGGALISNTGTWMQNTAQAWLVLQLSDSGLILGITLAVQLLPTLLLSAIAGVVADRLSKRKLLAIAQISMAVPSVVLSVLAIIGVVKVWHVLAIAFIFGIGRAFEAPARQSFVAEMVGPSQLSNAVSLNSASFNAGRLVGPAIAGVLIGALGGGVVGTGWVIGANGLSFLASLYALKIMDPKKLRPAPIMGQRRGAIGAGLRYVRARPDLVLILTCVFFLGAFGMNFQITSALMATEEFGKGATEFGVLGTILAVGSLVGSLLAALRNRPRMRMVVWAAMAFSATQIISGLMPTYVSYALILPFVGISVMTMVTTANALIQLTSSPEMRGRTASLYLMVFLGSVPLGAPVVGWIAEEFGVRNALVYSGVITAAGVCFAVIWFERRANHTLRSYLHQLRTRRVRQFGSSAAQRCPPPDEAVDRVA